MQNYIDWLKQKGCSNHTIRRYRTSLELFTAWYEHTTRRPFDPKLITVIDINDWQEYLKKTVRPNGKLYAISTIQNNIEGIKTYLRFLYHKNILSTDISNDVRKVKVQQIRQPKWLNRKEKAILLKYLENQNLKSKNPWRYYRNLCMCLTMMMGGLRESEVVSLNIYDLQDGFIYIRAGKGGKARMVPMNKDLLNLMKLWRKERDSNTLNNEKALFLSQKGGRITVSTIRNLCDRIRNETALKDLTPHVLRHTFGHDLATRGVPDRQIADLMGHADINTTRIYTTSAKDDLVDAVNLLSTGKYKDK